MEFTDYILEAAGVSDVDIMDIEVTQAMAEMAVLEAMMDCYEKQMVLLEYNEDAADEIFTEAETYIPEMAEFIQERYIYYARQDPKDGMWILARQDKRYTPYDKDANGNKTGRSVDKTNDIAVDKNGDPVSGNNKPYMSYSHDDVKKIADELNDNEKAFVKAQKNKEKRNQDKKAARKAKKGGGLGLQAMDYKAPPSPEEEKAKAKKREDLIRKIQDKQGLSRADAEAKADAFLSRGDAKATGLPVATLVSMGIANMDGTPITSTQRSKSSGRAYSGGMVNSDDFEDIPQGSPARTDVAKKSFGNSLKAFMSKAGDLAMRLAAFIVDTITSINFKKLGTKFSDAHSASTTVKLSATDAAVIDGFEQFVDIVNWYDVKFRPEYLESRKGQWTNNNVSRKLNDLKNNTEKLKNINKTDNKEEKAVEVSKIVDICNTLGRNELKKKLRTFQRNSAGFKTDLAVDNVPAALATAMREFTKFIVKTYNSEAKAIKQILKIAKDNDAVDNNKETNTDITMSTNETAEKTAAWAEEGWSMNLSEDEDFFLTESSYGSGYEDEDFYTESVPWNDENRRDLWMSPQERERDKAMNPEKYASSNPLWRPARELSGAIFVRRGREIDKYQCDRVVEKAKELLSSGQLHDQNVVAATKKLISEMGKCEQYSQDQLKNILIGYRNVFSKSPEINSALTGR